MIIKKRNLYLLTVMLSTIVLSSCIAAYAMADNGVLASEGTDTLVAVTGYTDLNGSFQFPEAGEKVAVLSPSSLPDWSQFEATMDGLREWGYEPVSGKYACVEERTLDDCLEDLIWALEDPEIKAIYCIRGGYGSSEVMDRLPVSLIEQANKPIIGFSDITAYHSAWTKANVPSIHSSTSAAFTRLPEQCSEAQRMLMSGEVPSYQCGGSEHDVEGSAKGILIGGNLATLTSVLDTAYDCTTIDEPYILFLEEVEEDYAHIHRFLTILDHKGILDKAEGLIFGEWVDYPEVCETYTGNSRGGKFKSVADMISRQFLKKKTIPVAFGFPAGHASTNYPLLMGTEVKLDVSENGFSLEWLNQ